MHIETKCGSEHMREPRTYGAIFRRSLLILVGDLGEAQESPLTSSSPLDSCFCGSQAHMPLGIGFSDLLCPRITRSNYKCRFLGPDPRDSDSLGLACCLGFSISNKYTRDFRCHQEIEGPCLGCPSRTSQLTPAHREVSANSFFCPPNSPCSYAHRKEEGPGWSIYMSDTMLSSRDSCKTLRGAG